MSTFYNKRIPKKELDLSSGVAISTCWTGEADQPICSEIQV